MLQRIQTVYFLAIAVLSSLAFFLPAANLYDDANVYFYTLDWRGLQITEGGETFLLNNVSTWGLKIISAVIPLLAFAVVFLYKKRLLQIRLSFVNMILMLGYYAMLFICVVRSAKILDASWNLKIPAAFPLVCVILSWLAIKAVGKDEALVKSLERLR